jgi:hypothetical protein
MIVMPVKTKKRIILLIVYGIFEGALSYGISLISRAFERFFPLSRVKNPIKARAGEYKSVCLSRVRVVAVRHKW